MAHSDKATLPAWVRVGEECQWWSKSQYTYHPIVVSSIDLSKKRIVVHFKENTKIWKTVPFSQMGANGPMQPPTSKSWALVNAASDGGLTSASLAAVPKPRKQVSPATQSVSQTQETTQISKGPKEDVDSSDEDAANIAVTWYDRPRENDRKRREEKEERGKCEAKAALSSDVPITKGSKLTSQNEHDFFMVPSTTSSKDDAEAQPLPVSVEEPGREQVDSKDAHEDEAWVQLETPKGQSYFWNRIDNSTAWAPPQGLRAKWTGEKHPSGRTYYWNEDGETVWVLPKMASALSTKPSEGVWNMALQVAAIKAEPEAPAAAQCEPGFRAQQPAAAVEAQTLVNEYASSAGPAAPQATLEATATSSQMPLATTAAAATALSSSSQGQGMPVACIVAVASQPTLAQPALQATLLGGAIQPIAPAETAVETALSEAAIERIAPAEIASTVPPHQAAQVACAQMLWHKHLKKKGATAFLWKQALQNATGGSVDDVQPEFPFASDTANGKGHCASSAQCVYGSLVSALWSHIGTKAQQPWMDKAGTQVLQDQIESPAPGAQAAPAVEPPSKAIGLPGSSVLEAPSVADRPVVALPSAPIKELVAPCTKHPQQLRTETETSYAMQLQLQIAMLQGELAAHNRFEGARSVSQPDGESSGKNSGALPNPTPNSEQRPCATIGEAPQDMTCDREKEVDICQDLVPKRNSMASKPKSISGKMLSSLRRKSPGGQDNVPTLQRKSLGGQDNALKNPNNMKGLQSRSKQRAVKVDDLLQSIGVRQNCSKMSSVVEQKASAVSVPIKPECKVASIKDAGQESTAFNKGSGEQPGPSAAAAADEVLDWASVDRLQRQLDELEAEQILKAADVPSTPLSLAPMPPPLTPPPSTPSAWAGYAASAPMPPPSTPPPSTPSAWAGYAASTAYWGYYNPSTWGGGYSSLAPLPPPPCDSEKPLPPLPPPPPVEELDIYDGLYPTEPTPSKAPVFCDTPSKAKWRRLNSGREAR